MEERRRLMMGQGGGISINNNGHAYVDLGLPSGTLWAATPLANNYTPAHPWGDPNQSHSTTMGGTVTPTYGDTGSETKYTYNDGLDEVLPEDDIVRILWGGDWRTASNEQWDEMLANVTYNMNGNRAVSIINGNSIYIPPFYFWSRTKVRYSPAPGVNLCYGRKYYPTGNPGPNGGNEIAYGNEGRQYCYDFIGTIQPGEASIHTFGLSSYNTNVSESAGTVTVTALYDGSTLTGAAQSDFTVSGGSCSLSGYNSSTGVLTISYPANTGTSSTTRTVSITYDGLTKAFTIYQTFNFSVSPSSFSVSGWGGSEDIRSTSNSTTISPSSITTSSNIADITISNNGNYKNIAVPLNGGKPYSCNQSSWMGSDGKITIPSPGNSAVSRDSLSFRSLGSGYITIKIQASTERFKDYGFLGLLDDASGSSASWSAICNNTENKFITVSGTGSAGELTYTYSNIAKGNHFIWFGYAKNASISAGNDNVTIEIVGYGNLCEGGAAARTGSVTFTYNGKSASVSISQAATLSRWLWDTRLMGSYIVLKGTFGGITNPVVKVDGSNAKVTLAVYSVTNSYPEVWTWNELTGTLGHAVVDYYHVTQNFFIADYNNANNSTLQLNTTTENGNTRIVYTTVTSPYVGIYSIVE